MYDNCYLLNVRTTLIKKKKKSFISYKLEQINQQQLINTLISNQQYIYIFIGMYIVCI